MPGHALRGRDPANPSPRARAPRGRRRPLLIREPSLPRMRAASQRGAQTQPGIHGLGARRHGHAAPTCAARSGSRRREAGSDGGSEFHRRPARRALVFEQVPERPVFASLLARRNRGECRPLPPTKRVGDEAGVTSLRLRANDVAEEIGRMARRLPGLVSHPIRGGDGVLVRHRSGWVGGAERAGNGRANDPPHKRKVHGGRVLAHRARATVRASLTGAPLADNTANVDERAGADSGAESQMRREPGPRGQGQNR